MKRAKCYIELGGGDGEWGGEEEGKGGIHLPEARESPVQVKLPILRLPKARTFPSLHQCYFQTLPISRPFEELASFLSLTMKWFKQGNLYQPLQDLFVLPKWYCSLWI